MKNFLILIIFSLVIQCGRLHNSEAQTKTFIIEVFHKISVNGMSDIMKDKLLIDKHIDLTEDNEICSLEIDTLKNTLFIQISENDCMVCPYENCDITSYRMNDSIYKIVLSDCQITPHVPEDNNQVSLEIYQYNLRTKSLTEETNKHSAFKIELKDFFKETTPDTVIQEYIKVVHPLFLFKKGHIFCEIDDNGEHKLLENKWLEGNSIEIKWTGKDFQKEVIYLEEKN